MAGAGNGDIAESGAEKVWMDTGVGVDQEALGGDSLGAMAGDCIAVVEVAVLARCRAGGRCVAFLVRG